MRVQVGVVGGLLDGVAGGPHHGGWCAGASKHRVSLSLVRMVMMMIMLLVVRVMGMMMRMMGIC
jgi:hypothetical protein